jgi:3-oxoacyl-[acyl-carrier-protein] synthase III
LQNKSFDIKNYISFELGSKVFEVARFCENEFGVKLTEKIIEKTGPKKLFLCDENSDTLDLSLKAWEKINSKIDIKKIQNLIYVTETNLYQYPGNSYLFVSKTKLSENLRVYDLNSGCTGFVEALVLANGLIGNSLIICSEAYSKNIHKFDRSVSTLFSDCATIFYYDKEVFSVNEHFSLIKKNSYDDLRKKKNESMKMYGINVFSFVNTRVNQSINNFLEKLKKKYSINEMYIHQASKVVVDYFKQKAEYKGLRIPANICDIGNTVSSSLPMLMLHDYQNLNKNEKKFIFLCGFGVGLGCTGLILNIKK